MKSRVQTTLTLHALPESPVGGSKDSALVGLQSDGTASRSMSVAPTNVLFICSDEHTRDLLGCYAHPVVRTPNLDRLAESGTCTFLDDHVGRLLDCLEETGLTETTRVIYSTDHGDMLGSHGYWAKSVMYEDSVAIPLIVSGPDIPAGESIDTPVSLVDCHPTILESTGLPLTDEDHELPGHSLVQIAQGHTPDRTVLSEYHDGGAITGMFIIRHGEWKYNYYPGYPPQLFNLATDPRELEDLGASDKHTQIRSECETALRNVVDPERVNQQAFDDQAQKIAALGGREAILAAGDFDAVSGYTPAPT